MKNNKTDKTEKFETMIADYTIGDVFRFRAALKRLNKADLLYFCVYCRLAEYDVNYGLDIFEIHKQLIM